LFILRSNNIYALRIHLQFPQSLNYFISFEGPSSITATLNSFYDKEKKAESFISYLFTSANSEESLSSFFCRPLFQATASNLGFDDSVLSVYHYENVPYQVEKQRMNHEEAALEIITVLKASKLLNSIVVIGHRVSHGGGRFSAPAIINSGVVDDIKRISHIAQKKNPHNIMGIELMTKLLPSLPAVAVFDTAYHSAMPEKASVYALPKEIRDDLQIRRYGSNGTSLNYISCMAESILRRKQMVLRGQAKSSFSSNFIVIRLDNEPCITAIVNGKPVDTSAGFFPGGGLVSGSKIGSIDPAIISHIAKSKGITIEEAFTIIENDAGLKAISGGEEDIRVLIKRAKDNDIDSSLAVDMFVYKLAKEAASLLVACGGEVHALIFTNDLKDSNHELREKIMHYLSPVFRVQVCPSRNKQDGKESEGIISMKGKPTSTLILVIPTQEEAMISLECKKQMPHLFKSMERSSIRNFFLG